MCPLLFLLDLVMKIKQALTFDDVAIVPKLSTVSSRADVSIKTSLGRLDLAIPLISSPMDTITGWEMALTMRRLGGLGIIHRFMPIDLQVEYFKLASESDLLGSLQNHVGVAVGLSEGMDRMECLYRNGARIFCVDVANGYSIAVSNLVSSIREAYPDIFLIAGSVCTLEGVQKLTEAGADAIRVGIGSGSACLTRVKTGVGIPQFSAIENCSLTNELIISDGGHKTPGDVAKALGAGANAVMLGGMFAGCVEVPVRESLLPSEMDNGMTLFRGMASKEVMDEFSNVSDWKTAEGISTFVPLRGSVRQVIQDITGGLRSCMSYCGAHTLEEFRETVEFIQQTSAGFMEGTSRYEKS